MSRKNVEIGATFGPTELLKTSRVLEARNFSTYQKNQIDPDVPADSGSPFQGDLFWGINSPPPPLPTRKER